MTQLCLECVHHPKETCIPAWGQCSHTFHYHCVEKWLKKDATCPLCKVKWEWSTNNSEY